MLLIVLMVWFTATVTFAAEKSTVYTRNCVACHAGSPFSLRDLFFEYLLKYSSERRLKAALLHYLKHPTKKASVVTEDLIDQYGLMSVTTLSDTDLRSAIDVYWEKYKVFGKIQ